MDSSSNTVKVLDLPLQSIGFEYKEISAARVTGCLTVTEKCCQAYKVLHGGISALIAEAMSSMGACAAIDFKPIAGTQLSVNHIKPAVVGDRIFAEALPIGTGKRIQVWEVRLWKTHGADETKNRILVSSSQATVFCDQRLSDDTKDVPAGLKMLASKL